VSLGSHLVYSVCELHSVRFFYRFREINTLCRDIMASQQYPGEKKVPPHVDALESDGASSIDTITALVAEGTPF